MEKQEFFGIKGLQEILNCGETTAIKVKKSGKIPYSQINRILVFNKTEVLNAIKINNPNESV